MRFLLLLCMTVAASAVDLGPEIGLGPIPPGSSTSADSNLLEGKTWEVPGTIGSTTPNSGAFTTLSATTPLPIASGGTASSTAATARSALSLAVYDFPMHLEAATVKTYYLLPSANVAYTINNLYAGDVSGTATVAIKINGTAVTGLSAVSVTSTPGTTNATALNSVSVADTVTVVITAASTPVDLFLNVKMTR